MPRQRVIDSVQAVADSGGTVVLRFNGPPAGSAWSGTASVPKAELGSNWFATFNDPNAIPLGAWLGRSFFGPVYVDSSERLVIVGTGLTPGQTYTGTFLGVSDWADALPFVSPDPNITSLSLDQLVAATVQAGLFIGGDYQGTWYSHAVSYFATAAALTAETNSRSSADTTLQGNINTEATDRANADNVEATTRANADNAEATNRTNADNTLQTNINNETSTRATADANEATNRQTEDHKRPQVVGTSSPLVGSNPPLSSTFAIQAGTDVETVTGGGQFRLVYPNPFPNGVLAVILQSVDGAVVIWVQTTLITVSDLYAMVTTMGGGTYSGLLHYSYILIGW